ncbi:DUF6313 family protein [Streptomyces sp. Qhu-G9]|uniref:DUF6313 family protein n=1 Tax=Streptomyces sp. Qhu-G9 TaxID=3452799 RepID=UPI0022AC1D79|nr:DUF6313 family protein [Streptomyces aurantiacus]WAU86398.1 DUF6313 family protein [Streptomyces aurantiacus]
MNGARLGWAAAYEVLTGITSPAKADPQRMTWPLSLAGWAAIPALIGGTVGYLITVQIQTHQAREFLRYDRALARGWPIGSGVIEAAARHLVSDRLAITGSRWSVPGAEALLQLRAIISNGDFTAYWRCHVRQEHTRLYPRLDQAITA